ncbi:MAG: plastoquinol--plastocyanin reductase [Candidatus Neomarinimicrobiota bacterium]|nr:MAG: plastoquinol--plastocyanin reductase [Candidatus Neomarinimicrobiota bacterium]
MGTDSGTSLPSASRRKFIDYLLGGGILAWLGTILYPLYRYLTPPKVANVSVNQVEAGLVKDFPLNTAKIVRFGRKPVIVIRKKTGEFTALTATCTHLDCTVQYKSDAEIIWCACHNGKYDLNGNNISGPPPKPLTRMVAKVQKDKVIVMRGEEA